ncbi:MAG: nucleotidyltransferase domain-containing protein [Promethearchaeia archaeon]
MKNYPHLHELENFLKKIDKQDLMLVLLFGSLVKGKYTQYSDIDVLCVYDRKFKDMKERFLTSYKYSDGLVQTKTLTLQEFKDNLRAGNSFLCHIVEEGIILYNKIPLNLIQEWFKEGKKNLKVKYFPP